MLKSAFAALALLVAGPALAVPPPPAPPPPPATAPLTVDTPLLDLVFDARTRPIIDKHMPGFAEKMESNPEIAQMFGGISLAGLQHDPHVKGMTPEALAKLGAELAEAQKTAP
jgi:hypothetical protein